MVSRSEKRANETACRTNLACLRDLAGPVEVPMAPNGLIKTRYPSRDLRKHQQKERGEANGRRYCGTVTKYSGTLLKLPSKMGRSADSGNTETVNICMRLIIMCFKDSKHVCYMLLYRMC